MTIQFLTEDVSMVKVRPTTVDDAECVIRLAAEFDTYLHELGPHKSSFSREAYIQDGFGPNAVFKGCIAELNGEVMGYVLYTIGYTVEDARRYVQLIDFFVLPQFWRQGVGTAMMNTMKDVCRKIGGDKVMLLVWTKNKDAIVAYQKMGATFSEDALEETLMVLKV